MDYKIHIKREYPYKEVNGLKYYKSMCGLKDVQRVTSAIEAQNLVNVCERCLVTFKFREKLVYESLI